MAVWRQETDDSVPAQTRHKRELGLIIYRSRKVAFEATFLVSDCLTRGALATMGIERLALRAKGFVFSGGLWCNEVAASRNEKLSPSVCEITWFMRLATSSPREPYVQLGESL